MPGPVADLIERATTGDDRHFITRLTQSITLSATLLPIYSVGVQVRDKVYLPSAQQHL